MSEAITIKTEEENTIVENIIKNCLKNKHSL